MMDKEQRKKVSNVQKCINLAGFTVRASFFPAEHVLIKNELLHLIDKYYLETGFEQKNCKVVDFEIDFIESQMRSLTEHKNENIGYLSYAEWVNKRRVEYLYFAGISPLQLVFKDILYELLDEVGLMIHASGVLDKKGGLHLFLGSSEGGKSTTARILEESGWSHFCDDMTVLRMDDGLTVYSPPLIEKEHSPKYQKYNGRINIYFVNKNKEVKIEKVDSDGDVLKRLLDCIWTKDGGVRQSDLSMAINLLKSCHFYILNRNLDGKKLMEKIDEI